MTTYREARRQKHRCPHCRGFGMLQGGPLGVHDCPDCDKGYTRLTRGTSLRIALGLLSDDERKALASTLEPQP